jgi:hypothetical protein
MHDTVSQQVQSLLKAHYRQLGDGLFPTFRDVGFKCFSQFEEDGILLFVFSVLGEGSRRAVEICAGDGRECMATNLVINHGWEGILFDGNEQNVEIGSRFFCDHPATFLCPPRFRHAWITAENVNDLVADAGDVDLLSLDIDGNEYWVWKAMTAIRPRVAIIETHDIIPSDLALTIPYDPAFDYTKGPEPDFRSASLLAMTKLARSKGYRLIGAHRYGFNAFFLREDEPKGHLFPEASIESIHGNPHTRKHRVERWPRIKHMPWVEI